MTDIVERAKAALNDPEMDPVHADRYIRALVAELQAARADNEVMFGRGYEAGVRQERENQAAREARS